MALAPVAGKSLPTALVDRPRQLLDAAWPVVQESRTPWWRAALCLGRPRTTVPSLLCFALGHSFTGAPASSRFYLAALLTVLVPIAANLHNAYTDVAEDRHNLPGRAALVASLGAKRLWWLLAALSTFMLAGAALLGTRFALLMALAVIGLHQYSSPPCRSKNRPVLGLWVFAQVVTFPFLFGWASEPDRMLQTAYDHFARLLYAVPGPDPALVHHGYRYFAMMHFVTLWFMAKGMFKNVPDFHGDTEAGLRTSATRYRTWRGAAIAASVATVAAYLSLALLVVVGLEDVILLAALAWLPAVVWNCLRLVRADDAALGNRYLRTDMFLSSGFIATVLWLLAPGATSARVLIAGTLLLFGSDLLDIDSRRGLEAEVPPVSP